MGMKTIVEFSVVRRISSRSVTYCWRDVKAALDASGFAYAVEGIYAHARLSCEPDEAVAKRTQLEDALQHIHRGIAYRVSFRDLK